MHHGTFWNGHVLQIFQYNIVGFSGSNKWILLCNSEQHCSSDNGNINDWKNPSCFWLKSFHLLVSSKESATLKIPLFHPRLKCYCGSFWCTVQLFFIPLYFFACSQIIKTTIRDFLTMKSGSEDTTTSTLNVKKIYINPGIVSSVMSSLFGIGQGWLVSTLCFSYIGRMIGFHTMIYVWNWMLLLQEQ